MSPHFAIRDALLSDVSDISVLIRGESRFCTIDSSGEGAEEYFATITPEAIAGYIRSPNFIYRVGVTETELAGVVAIRDGNHLYHLFVASKFHRRGFGSALWEHASTTAIVNGNTKAFTVNSALHAVPFYTRLGFEVQGPGLAQKGIAFVPMKLSGRGMGG